MTQRDGHKWMPKSVGGVVPPPQLTGRPVAEPAPKVLQVKSKGKVKQYDANGVKIK